MIYTVTLNPAIDYVMRPLTLDMGFTNRSSGEQLFCGGNGINVSTLLNELKVANTAYGIVAGFTGDYLVKTLQQNGVSANFVQLDEGFTRINIKLNGIVMTMVNGMGPDIPQEKVDELLERIDYVGEGDTLVLTGSIPKTLPENMYDVIMKRLAGRGTRFVVDAPGNLLLESLPAHPFLIKPNNHEVGRIFDVHPETPEECIPFAKELHERGAQNVIVSCGGHGSMTRTKRCTSFPRQRFSWSTPQVPVTPWLPASSPRPRRVRTTRRPCALPPPVALPPRQATASQSVP